MAEFLTTSGISHKIDDIIINAKRDLFLVSPYLQLSQIFYERLIDASGRGVIIHIIYGKVELKLNEKESLSSIENLKLHFSENLHAKCYYNEEEMVITSMNMYEFSEKNNREMGVLIRNDADHKLFTQAATETNSIIASSVPSTLFSFSKTSFAKNTSGKKEKLSIGFCIRCNKRIEFDASFPYCDDCLIIWATYGNPYYDEDYCHSCGEFSLTSKAEPLCSRCFKETKR